ncbi:DUF1194 domain-containing protein [Aquibium sp. A9E412]|uniref:DUF1194 domain-containing protein n=1 Tax=Aquibium sp. A9E412 TaxID=2976767 RepID=UPI0025B1E030|nr:DUF1194 domain-containing protein [Aquibium sp. A9E412]MDN2568328.1 DUF1194 domain-containing protein [Aquibium sp. A9E412]
MVDVALVLAVDVSLSMSREELVIQRDGYAAALTDRRVLDAIAGGLHGRIAVTYVEWAGQTSQTVVVPWTVIAGEDDARAVAGMLTASPPTSARRTSISGALGFARDLLAESGLRALRRVIDVSGDGPNNQGARVDETRDAVTAEGITVNGLPLMTNGGLTSSFSIEDLDVYYSECVIGGPGAFMIPVNDWSQFAEAVRRKLVIELAGTPPVLRAGAGAGYDCEIGEKMWRNRPWLWDDTR